MLWSALRDAIQRNLLGDITRSGGTTEFEPADLLIYTDWALRRFCAHTARPIIITFDDSTVKVEGDTPVLYDLATDLDYTLPIELYESLELSGAVYATLNGKRSFYDPADESYNGITVSSPRFENWSRSILSLSQVPGAGATLAVRGYTFWSVPADAEDETFVMDFPSWAMSAIGMLACSYALSAKSTRTANIRRFAENPERGSPEDNPVRRQQEWLVKQYEMEIAKYPAQTRTHFGRGYLGTASHQYT